MSTIKVSNLQNASAASPAIVLDANSRATLNGLSYPTEGSLSGRNRIINGDMRIDARNAGASVTPSDGNYLVDRYRAGLTQASKFSAQQNTADAPTTQGFTHCLKVTSLSSYSVTSGDEFGISQLIEGNNFSDFAWGTASAKTITLSFWVRSSLTGTFGGTVFNSPIVRSYTFSYSISAANTWEYKTIAIPGDTVGTWQTGNGLAAYVQFSLGAGSSNLGTAGSWATSSLRGVTGQVNLVGTNGATWYITGVQLEAGSVATPFERRLNELQLCQRYYYFIGNDGTNAAIGAGFTTGTTAFVYGALPVEMRTSPTISYAGTLSDLNFTHTGVSAAANSLTNQGSGRKSYAISLGSATGTTNLAGVYARVTSASSALTFSAEL